MHAAIAQLEKIEYPAPTKEAHITQIKDTYGRVVGSVQQLPTSPDHAVWVIEHLHDLEPPTETYRVSTTSSAMKRNYKHWRVTKQNELHTLVWARYPEAYQNHLEECATCTRNREVDLEEALERHPELHDPALKYLESKYSLRSDHPGWRHFQKAVGDLIPIEGFPSSYLSHVRRCNKECGSWNVFVQACEADEQLSTRAISDALEGLGQPKHLLFRAGQKASNNVMIYTGCQMLTPHIVRAPQEAQQDLILRVINVAAGVDKGRGGKRPEFWSAEASGLVKLPATPADIRIQNFRLDAHANDIVMHVERRLRFALELLTLVQGDHHVYTGRSALCTYGADTVPSNYHRCHSAIIALVDRKTEPDAPIVELGSGGLFQDRLVLHRLNHTIPLPAACNEVDSATERVVRPQLQARLNLAAKVQKKEAIRPQLVFFIGELNEALTALVQEYRVAAGPDSTKLEYLKRQQHALRQIQDNLAAFINFCVQDLLDRRDATWADDFAAYRRHIRSTKYNE